jgi:oxygen-independent coproporphyrinogen-3 oxidase
MQRLGVLEAVEEFTVEANPETLDDALAGVLRRGGVNRLSLGAQSFDAELLDRLGRCHGPEAVGRAVTAGRAAGFEQVGIDLMFAIPGQSWAQLDADLHAAIALDVEHVSYYQLTLESGTAMAADVAAGRLRGADEHTQRAMYERVIQRLSEAGYEHYEISNWARPGCRCRHNMTYWTGGDYVGLGPSAASYVNGRRWRNVPDLKGYLADADAPTADHEQLDAARHVGEQMMLRLRLLAGMPRDWLAQHLPADDARWGRIDNLIDAGLLERTATHVRLSREGLFVADAVVGELL